MNKIHLAGLCEGVFSFIRYMRNWRDKGVLSLDIIFYETNPDLKKKCLDGIVILVLRKSYEIYFQGTSAFFYFKFILFVI